MELGWSPLVVETRALARAAPRRLVRSMDDGAQYRRDPLFCSRCVAKCQRRGDPGAQGARRCTRGKQSTGRARWGAVSDRTDHPRDRGCGPNRGRRPVRDTLIVATTVFFFALLATVHLTIAFGLARRPPRWRALVAFVAFPLAPYFALRE